MRIPSLLLIISIKYTQIIFKYIFKIKYLKSIHGYIVWVVNGSHKPKTKPHACLKLYYSFYTLYSGNIIHALLKDELTQSLYYDQYDTNFFSLTFLSLTLLSLTFLFYFVGRQRTANKWRRQTANKWRQRTIIREV